MARASVLAAAAAAAVAIVAGISPSEQSAARGAIDVAPGFRVELYARGLRRPTALAFGPDGRLYVAQETGEIVALARAGARRATVPRGDATAAPVRSRPND